MWLVYHRTLLRDVGDEALVDKRVTVTVHGGWMEGGDSRSEAPRNTVALYDVATRLVTRVFSGEEATKATPP